MVQPHWKTVWRFLKKLKIELPYDAAIALLGIYPKDTDVVKRRAICIPMFIGHNSQIVERAKMPFIRQMDKEDMVHIYNGILLSRQKGRIPTFVSTWTGLGEIILSEISQAESIIIWFHLLVGHKE